MRLSKKVNKKNTIYTIIGDYININGKRSTYAYESLGNDDKLIERFGKENTMDKVFEYIDSLNKTIKGWGLLMFGHPCNSVARNIY